MYSRGLSNYLYYSGGLILLGVLMHRLAALAMVLHFSLAMMVKYQVHRAYVMIWLVVFALSMMAR